MKAKTDRLKPEVFYSAMLALSAGVSLGLSFLPLPLWFLAWFALVPLFVLWDRTEDTHWAIAEIYTAFLMAFAVGFFWPLLHTYDENPVVPFISLALIPLVWTLPFVLALPVLKQHGRFQAVTLVVGLFLCLEMGLSQGPLAFPWPMLGHTQAAAIGLIQFAEYTGVIGVSLLVLLLNALAFGAYVSRKLPMKGACAGSLIALLLVCVGYSTWRTDDLKSRGQYLTVGVVQPALPDAAWTGRFGVYRIAALLQQSDSLIQAMSAPPVLMVWPSMSLPPSGVAAQRVFDERLQTWTDTNAVALLTGALMGKGGQNRPVSFTNSALLYLPHDSTQRYDQRYSLPFWPDVALEEQAPWIPRSPYTRFLDGAGQPTLRFDGFQVGVLLGADLLMGDYARRYAKKGAELLVSLTQEGWWGQTPGFKPHLHYARLRAIESRRSLVQVGATGSTALIGPDGSVLFQSPLRQPDVHVASVPLVEVSTVYSRFGNWLGWLVLALSLTWGGFLLLQAMLRWSKERSSFPGELEPTIGR